MKTIRQFLAQRRLRKLMKPCPELRERRLRQLSAERAERYRRNAAEIEQMLGGVR